MELDKEDAEAGSILIALANHQPPQQRPSQQVNIPLLLIPNAYKALY